MKKIPRRRFMQAGIGSFLVGSALSKHSSADENIDIYMEPAKTLPVVRNTDVVVCGAGPAGIGAAISAARSGAKTLLIENHGCLGGIWTSGLLSYLLDFQNKTGLVREILDRLKARNACRFERMCDPEAMKILLDEMCLAEGIEVMFHSRVVAARRNEKNRLDLVVTESKSGRRAVRGKVFVDATGEGDLSVQCGCGFDLGHPEDGGTQPMSFIVVLDGVNANEIDEYVSWRRPGETWAGPKDKLAELIRETSGHLPSYAKPSLFPVRDDYMILMANHEYRVDGFDTEHVTKATFAGRAELHRMIDGLRTLGGPWKNIRICNTPEQIGVRESRRIHGRYTITDEDIVEGRQPDDTVCVSKFSVDVHSTDPEKSKGIDNRGHKKAKPFGIPFRSLLAKDVDGLLMAGRCISGSFFAHSSYRVTGNAVPMGEAAGCAAALAASKNALPHQLDWKDIAAKLDEIRKTS